MNETRPATSAEEAAMTLLLDCYEPVTWLCVNGCGRPVSEPRRKCLGCANARSADHVSGAYAPGKRHRPRSPRQELGSTPNSDTARTVVIALPDDPSGDIPLKDVSDDSPLTDEAINR